MNAPAWSLPGGEGAGGVLDRDPNEYRLFAQNVAVRGELEKPGQNLCRSREKTQRKIAAKKVRVNKI
jgi:hypothetical protein